MTPTTFTFLTIDEWLKINPDLDIEDAECMTCDGKGEHQCECGDEHECGDCNGSGRVDGCTYPELYKEQLERDVKRLKKYYRWEEGIENPVLDSLNKSVSVLIRNANCWRPRDHKK